MKSVFVALGVALAVSYAQAPPERVSPARPEVSLVTDPSLGLRQALRPHAQPVLAPAHLAL